MSQPKLFVFYIGHPAHYYSSMALAGQLSSKGNKILFLVRPKDIVKILVKDCPYEITFVSRRDRGNSKFSMLWSIIRRELKLIHIAFFRNPFMFIGTDLAITHIGKIFRIPAVILNEDDESVVPLLAKYGFKFSASVLSPATCTFEKYSHKKISYDGFHKLLYLSPQTFQDRFKNFRNLIDISRPFFILRFSRLAAHHDVGEGGIENETAKAIIDKLQTFGRVFISSERELPPDLEKFRFGGAVQDMHFYLANAQILLSDSQSMSVEAALLGTPSIRVSSFKGRIGVLEELEHKYQLSFAVMPGDNKSLFQKIDEILLTGNYKKIFSERRKKLLNDKINVLDFFVWYIENFPTSHKIMKENPDYQYHFK